MAEFFDHVQDGHRTFIERQPVFFVASGTSEGRVNLSPKGMDTLRVVDQHTIAYVDLTGSGNETAAHLAVDGRLTMMWCSFDRAPLILRAYGRGRVVPVDDHGLGIALPDVLGARQVVVCDVDSVQTSCGYAVPVMDLRAERQTLTKWYEANGKDAVEAVWDDNRESIDGVAIPAPAR